MRKIKSKIKFRIGNSEFNTQNSKFERQNQK